MAQHAFWIIVDGETPTSFRSRQREDLLPTLHQLQRKQPQVKLLWFERGRLWASPTEAREALIVRRKTPAGRSREWRPGGDHVDPRAKYAISRDQKRARFKARLGYDRSQGPPHSQSRDSDPGDAAKPATPPPASPPRPYRTNRPSSPGGPSSRPPAGRPPSNRPPTSFERRPPARPAGRSRAGGDWFSPPPSRESAPKPKPKGFGDRPWRPRGPWKPKKPVK